MLIVLKLLPSPELRATPGTSERPRPPAVPGWGGCGRQGGTKSVPPCAPHSPGSGSLELGGGGAQGSLGPAHTPRQVGTLPVQRAEGAERRSPEEGGTPREGAGLRVERHKREGQRDTEDRR